MKFAAAILAGIVVRQFIESPGSIPPAPGDTLGKLIVQGGPFAAAILVYKAMA